MDLLLILLWTMAGFLIVFLGYAIIYPMIGHKSPVKPVPYTRFRPLFYDRRFGLAEVTHTEQISPEMIDLSFDNGRKIPYNKSEIFPVDKVQAAFGTGRAIWEWRPKDDNDASEFHKTPTAETQQIREAKRFENDLHRETRKMIDIAAQFTEKTRPLMKDRMDRTGADASGR